MKLEIGQSVRNIFNAPTIDDARDLIKKTVDKYSKSAPEFVTRLENNIDEGLVVYNT